MNLSGALRIALAALGLAAAAVGLLVLVWMVKPVPRFPRSGPSTQWRIERTLEQIDNAKQVFAIEHHISPDTVPTREQLQPYLLRDFWQRGSRLGAEYRINAVGIPAEAVLKKRLDSIPPKTIIRFSTNLHSYEIVQPAALEGK